MHLWVEVVEHAHLVALGQQPVGEVGADEAGAAGDQDAHDRGVRLANQARLGLATPRSTLTPGCTRARQRERDRDDEEEEAAANAASSSTPSWPRKLTKNASRTAMPLIVNGTSITRKSSGPIT